MGRMRFRSSLSISVAVHVFALVAWTIMPGRWAAQTERIMEIIELEPEQAAADGRYEKTKRVVKTELGRETDRPPPDAFLGERNQIVERQTVHSARIGEAIMEMMKRPRVAGREIRENFLRPRSVLSALGIPVLPPAKNRADAARMFDRTLAPGDSLSQEYVKGLKESERTALSTREFVFYGYFQRIREQLDVAWSRSLREQLLKYYKNGRQLASEMDHTTRVLVTLNSGGEITRVQVVEESGTRDLDDAAVKAFNKAGPFPNPPKGIVDKEGNIKIRWDFILRT
ncbi:MAG: hypothetical protein A2583_06055 [Bdellovibrionales bacterium RIFOXYD1_FULL_53_11]|nr:MAG: hypothetical protein A2583_06055 [Bdellovibrionales bacterium RIFOXYD1_FULL_53_11]